MRRGELIHRIYGDTIVLKSLRSGELESGVPVVPHLMFSQDPPFISRNMVIRSHSQSGTGVLLTTHCAPAYSFPGDLTDYSPDSACTTFSAGETTQAITERIGHSLLSY